MGRCTGEGPQSLRVGHCYPSVLNGSNGSEAARHQRRLEPKSIHEPIVNRCRVTINFAPVPAAASSSASRKINHYNIDACSACLWNPLD